MRPASVGFQCPSCVDEGAKSTRSGRTTYGGKPSGNPALTSQILIGINVAVWLLITATGGGGSPWVDRLALRPDGGPYSLPSGDLVLLNGVSDGAYWQVVTTMFTHVTILHLAFNMIGLFIFGPQLEAVFGRARYLALYFLSGLVGSVFVYWLAALAVPTVGASGAIFGLFAAYFVVALKMRANVSSLVVLLGINAVITFTNPGISWQGHLGGFLGGLALAGLFVHAPRRGRPLWHWAGVGALGVLLLVAFVARTVALA